MKSMKKNLMINNRILGCLTISDVINKCLLYYYTVCYSLCNIYLALWKIYSVNTNEGGNVDEKS